MLMQPDISDASVLAKAVSHARDNHIVLPTFSELAQPWTISNEVINSLDSVSKDKPHPLNLYRINWFNQHHGQGFDDTPAWLEIPQSVSGVKARIVVVLGDAFPMIAARLTASLSTLPAWIVRRIVENVPMYSLMHAAGLPTRVQIRRRQRSPIGSCRQSALTG